MIICCGYGCIICPRSFFFRLPFWTYPTNIRIKPIKNRNPPILSSAASPLAARGNAKMKSNRPRKNVRRGFQEELGVETLTDKAGRGQPRQFSETRIVTLHILSK
jgi:hypothetical protein